MSLDNIKKINKGFTMVELVLAVAIFSFLTLAMAQIYFLIVSNIISYREQSTISALANQNLEVTRNMDYANVGTASGSPSGNLPDASSPSIVIVNGVSYQIYYSVQYIDDPADGLAPADTSPNDYKQVKLYIKNTRTNFINSFTTNIAPPVVEDKSVTGGNLLIKVFNANGGPVSGTSIQIQNNVTSPTINFIRTSASDGTWLESNLPPSDNSYQITVTKAGYSSDQTRVSNSVNPNPVKPYATVKYGQTTQVSFSIDLLSNLTINTLDQQTCGATPNVGVGLKGAKLIGTSPDVLKFNNNYTSNSSGQISLSNIEWDTYAPYLNSDSYMIYSASPIDPIFIPPNASQNVNLILGSKTANSLRVIVKDVATGMPVGGATVRLQSSLKSFNSSQSTSGAVFSQNDWSGGPGQSNIGESNEFDTSDTSIDYSVPGQLTLKKISGSYPASGIFSLTSSTFNTQDNGTDYNFLSWQPASQDSSTQVKFQIATSNNNSGVFSFTGPDGTGATYYTASGSSIYSGLNHNRYIRYKVFLSTTDSAKTPILTGVNIGYGVGCNGPGQVMFSGLSPSSDYQITVSKNGYATKTVSNFNISGNNTLQVLLSQ